MWLYYLVKFKWLIGGVSLAASLLAIASYYENKGYNRAVVELKSKTTEAIQKATNKAIAEAQRDMRKALKQQQRIFDAELERVKNERIVETEIKEIYRDVDRVVIKNECTSFSDDIMQLLNNSINTSNRSSGKNGEN